MLSYTVLSEGIIYTFIHLFYLNWLQFAMQSVTSCRRTTGCGWKYVVPLLEILRL